MQRPWIAGGALLLLAAVATRAADREDAVLVALLDSKREAVRAELRTVLVARGADGAAIVDRLAPDLGTDAGRALAESILKDLRAASRDDAVLTSALAAAPLSERTRWRLGIGRTRDGAPVRFFDARTFARVEMGVERLKTLEYLVCPDPAPEGRGDKRYECLAGMAAAEWTAFRAAYEPGCAMVLRRRKADGTLEEVTLTDALPWAKPGDATDGGVKIGANHDERANRRLPPHETPIQIGIARAPR